MNDGQNGSWHSVIIQSVTIDTMENNNGPLFKNFTCKQTLMTVPNVFSWASAKAERSLSSLSCVCVYVDQNKGDPPPPLEMAYPLGIPWFQVQIWIHHKNLS